MKYKNILILFVFFFGVFGLAHSSFAAGNIYVSTTGNDTTGTGAIGLPVRTIAHAITHITDSSGGWNIILRGGTYYEHDIFMPQAATGVTGAWNTIRSYPGEWAIIDGQRSCTSNVGAVIRNGGFQDGTDRAEQKAQYWLFERLEIKNGGNTSGGLCASGIWWAFGPATMRYCYIHDNLSNSPDENPAGLNGQMQKSVTIEFCKLYNNGTYPVTRAGNDRQISTQTMEECCYGENDNATDVMANAVRDNVIRYNLVDANGGSFGIGMKASNRMTPSTGCTPPCNSRDITDYTYRSHGDKIEHNIVLNTTAGGIVWQSDWAQIYNNIVDSTSTLDGYGSIVTRRDASVGVDTIYPCVYNNTTRGDTAGFSCDADGKYFQTFQLFLVNNIFDLPASGNYNYPITVYHAASNGPAGWFSGLTWPTSFSISGVSVDRNYLYRGTQTSGHDVLYGKPGTGSGYGYTITQFESTFSKDLFMQATQESGVNKLWVGTSGASQYIAVGAHNLGETGKTVATSGLGGSHPYLSGVTMPTYIGATNPTSNVWVAGVMALDASYFTGATNGSIPTWIEGSVQPPADTTPPSPPSGLLVS